MILTLSQPTKISWKDDAHNLTKLYPRPKEDDADADDLPAEAGSFFHYFEEAEDSFGVRILVALPLCCRYLRPASLASSLRKTSSPKPWTTSMVVPAETILTLTTRTTTLTTTTPRRLTWRSRGRKRRSMLEGTRCGSLPLCCVLCACRLHL
jgi:hypothetical protein